MSDHLDRLLDSSPTGNSAGAAPAPTSERDALLALHLIHDLHLAPLSGLGDRARWQHHPAVAALKSELETGYLERLEARLPALVGDAAEDPVARIRSIAARDLVPPVYEWLSEEATPDEIAEFLALEGGPDGGFDDLVAVCQLGLSGEPKLELARNYWDEMGRGTAEEVHSTLHRDHVEALELPRIDRAELPIEALRRSALTGVLATNRRLQPELVGALGTIEIQAGPRCRRVLEGLRRIGAGPEALAFYEEHAVADPRHGKDWLDRAIRPLAGDPAWAAGMIRGAEYRCAVNHDFFARLAAIGDRRRAA